MESVAAALGDEIDIGSRITAVGRIVLAGLHLELLNRVGIGYSHAAVEITTRLDVVSIHAVNFEVVVLAGAAVRGEVGRTGDGARRSGTASTQGAGVLDFGSDASIERDDLRIVPAGQGQIVDHSQCW